MVTFRDGQISKVVLASSGKPNFVLDCTDGVTICEDGNASTSLGRDGIELLVMTEPEFTYEYQNLAFWGDFNTRGNVTAGYSVAGRETRDASRIPVSATYTGRSMGLAEEAGNIGLVLSDVTVKTDFTSADLTTRTTDLIPITSAPNFSNRDLDLNGTLIKSGNGHAGAVSTNSGMQGSAQTTYFGPNAEELGGTFAVENAQGQTYVGGFVTKR